MSGIEGICDTCGDTVGVMYTVHPYQSEINNDDTMVYICRDCYNTACEDI